tara:strand:+ start:245 stop:664 length:420 start_codon:yes stop_codon:yes gene_type:complete
MMRKTMILAAALAAAAGMAAAEEKRSFGCGYGGDDDRAEIDARAGNQGMKVILQEYRDRWDAQHIRAQCEAFDAGRSYHITCLDGHRDWDAIAAMVPADLWSLPRKALRPHYLALQEQDDGMRDAISYCREVGALGGGR